MLNNLAVLNIYDKNVAISGYNGYIGSSLLKNMEFRTVKFDELDQFDIEIFIHLASNVTGNNLSSFLQNIELDETVFSYCHKKKIKIIYSSSNNVYPLRKQCSEKTKRNGNDYYSMSKIVAEDLLESREEMLFVILRIGDVFGFGQRHGNFFKAMENSVLNYESLKLYGDGVKTRSYIYIKELVNILLFFIKNDKYINNSVYNICFEKAFSLKNIIEEISAYTGLKIEKIPYIDTINERTMKNQSFKKTEYKYNFDMKTAIQDYIHDIKKN